jgi:hypothetical protein
MTTTQTVLLILAAAAALGAWVHTAVAHSRLPARLEAWWLAHTTAQERADAKAIGAMLWPLVLERLPGIEAALLAERPIEALIGWLARQGVQPQQVLGAIAQGWREQATAAPAPGPQPAAPTPPPAPPPEAPAQATAPSA